MSSVLAAARPTWRYYQKGGRRPALPQRSMKEGGILSQRSDLDIDNDSIHWPHSIRIKGWRPGCKWKSMSTMTVKEAILEDEIDSERPLQAVMSFARVTWTSP